MCGLVGVASYGEAVDKKFEEIRTNAMIFITTELLQLTQTRGKEATGVSVMFNNSDYMALKMGVPAEEFVTRFGGADKDYDSFVRVWRENPSPPKMVIGHCRKPSTGGGSPPDDNNNNHPIRAGRIIGAHNGTLTNHQHIFDNLGCKRDGKVDSEAIFHLLNHFTNEGKDPFSPESIQEVCKRLSGTYAVMAMNGNNPYQLVVFRDSRPLEIAIVKNLKMVFIASETTFLKQAIMKYNMFVTLYSSKSKMPKIESKDVVIETLSDDHMYIFNNNTIMDDASTLDKISIKERIPRTGKIWLKSKDTKEEVATKEANPTSVGVENQAGTTHDHSLQKTSAVETSTHTTRTATCTETDRCGMVFSKELKRYEPVESVVKETKAHGSVEININKSEIKGVGGKPVGSSKFELIESKTPVDELIGNTSKVTELNHSEKESCLPGNNVIYLPEHLPDEEGAKEVVINMKPNTVALIRASEIAEKCENFSNDEELIDALDMRNVKDLTMIPLYTLANRIKRAVFKEAYEKGFVEGVKEESKSNVKVDDSLSMRAMLDRAKAKVEKSRSIIRNAKCMVFALTDVIVENPRVMNSLAADLLSSTSPDELKSVFKEGDLKTYPLLRRVLDMVSTPQEEKNKNEKESSAFSVGEDG